MGRIEQLAMTQAAQGTSLSVGIHDAASKLGLKESLAHGPRCVLATEGLVGRFVSGSGPIEKNPRLVDLHREHQPSGIVTDNVHGEVGEIVTGIGPIEVRQRRSRGHGTSQADVVAMSGIGPSVGIPEQVRGPIDMIRVGARGDGGDREGNPKAGRTPDSLRSEQRDSDAVEIESALQGSARQFSIGRPELREPFEGCKPRAPLAISSHPPRIGELPSRDARVARSAADLGCRGADLGVEPFGGGHEDVS